LSPLRRLLLLNAGLLLLRLLGALLVLRLLLLRLFCALLALRLLLDARLLLLRLFCALLPLLRLPRLRLLLPLNPRLLRGRFRPLGLLPRLLGVLLLRCGSSALLILLLFLSVVLRVYRHDRSKKPERGAGYDQESHSHRSYSLLSPHVDSQCSPSREPTTWPMPCTWTPEC